MGYLNRLIDRRSLGNPSQSLVDALLPKPTKAGNRVSEHNALTNMDVYSCVTVISQDIASLPLVTYKRLDPRGKERATTHPLYTLLHDEPNPEMSSLSFRETLQLHLLIWGNAYAEIEYDNAGRVTALWPLRPDKVRVTRDLQKRLWYTVELPRSTTGQPTTAVLPSERVFHIPGLAFDGLVGYSVLGLVREAVALGMAQEEFAARFYANDALPGAVLTHPKSLSQPARDRLRQDWTVMHQGLTNSHRMAVLEEGLDVKTLGVPQRDAQFLEGRKFSRTQVAGWYRVAPPLIGDLERATFANIEQLTINHVVFCLRAWMVRWEQTIWRKLLTQREQQRYFTEFLIAGLQRGDFKSRMEAYNIGINAGIWSPDDVREMENQNPIPDGRGAVYRVPLNTAPAPTPSQADELLEAQVAAAEALSADPEDNEDEGTGDGEDTGNDVTEANSLQMKAQTVRELIQAGYDPADAARVAELPEMKHTGILPATLQRKPDPKPEPRAEKPSVTREEIRNDLREAISTIPAPVAPVSLDAIRSEIRAGVAAIPVVPPAAAPHVELHIAPGTPEPRATRFIRNAAGQIERTEPVRPVES